MKKLTLLIALFTSLTFTLAAQQVEIYPQMGPQGEIRKFSPDGKWILTDEAIYDATTGRELKQPYGTSILDFSPDMKRYIQGTGTRLRVRNWETDAILCTIQAPAQPEKVVFSPDGRQIAAWSGRGIRVWDAANGQEVISAIPGVDFISDFCYSADSKNILYEDAEGIKVYDLQNKRQIRSFAVAGTERDRKTFSPDGKRYLFATSTSDNKGTVTIYDTETGREIRKLTGHNSYVTALAYSPDGQKIISVDRKNVMKIWDAGTGRELRSSELEQDHNYNMKFSADSRRIAYCVSIDAWKQIIILDAGNYRELLAIKPLPRIRNVAYTVNEKQAIVETNDTISLWNTETGRRIWALPVKNRSSVYLSPDKRFFAKTDPSTNTAQGADNISIYDTATGKLVRSWSSRRNVTIYDIIWSQDSKNITTVPFVTINTGNTLDSWNVENGQLITSSTSITMTDMESLTNPIRDYFFSPDANRIVYRFENSIQIYEARSTRRLLTINGSFNRVRWSLDGRRILTASSDGTVKIWDAQTGREIPSSIKHGWLSDIEYSPNNRQFVTGGDNEWVVAWNAENGAKLWEKKIAPVYAINYSVDGKRIIVVTRTKNVTINNIYILDAANGNTLFYEDERSADISPDGKWIITASQDGSVRIWSAETYIEKARLIAYDDGEWLAVTPDGFYNASAKGDQYLNARVGSTVSGIDRYRSTFNKPAVVQARLSNSGRMASHKDMITSVAVNSGSTRIASVSADKTIKLWDLESGRELRSIANIGGLVNAVSFSPDGKTLLHGAEDKTVRIWNAETGAAIRTISGHTDYVNEARYSPDGKRIASCADDKLIKIWDAETGREIRTLSGHTDLICVVAWSPDGKRLASGSDATEKAIRIWDAESGRVLQTIPNQKGRIYGLAYSPDGKRLASCTPDEPALKIWDAETGRQIRSISIEDSKPISLAWSPDSKCIAVGKAGGITIFDAESGAEIVYCWIGGIPLSVTWTPDGRRIVTAANTNNTRQVEVYDALRGEEL
jgi:WD40 repeat protein